MATVMVVDDVAANRDIVRLLLGYRGHEVIEAHDGADALRLAHEHHPDIVVSDVLMPGIDGLELVHRLRADPDRQAAQAPVIFYTANYLEPETRPIAEACGVSQVVLRSQDPHELLDAVEAALAGGPVSVDVVPSDDFAQTHAQTVNAKLIEKVRELHHTERRFEAMAVASPVGIALIDADGEADYINPRLAEIMRTPREGLLGRGWLACLDSTAHPDALDLLRGNAEERRFTHCLELPDGTPRYLRLQLRQVHDDEAELAGGVLMVDDVSDLVAAEEKLRDETRRRQQEARRRDAERLDSLRRMAGGAAHDFNNILGAILGYTALAIETIEDAADVLTPDLSASLLGDLDQVVKGGERAKALTQQLLAFGRREITQPTTFDLNALLRDLVGTLRDAAGEASVVLQLTPGPADVRADPRQIGQVLVNLVANGGDATSAGGAITVTTSATPAGDAVVTISDTGRGMAPDVLERAFEPFFTTKRSTGTAGLGLSTAHGIVSQAGGQLTLASTPGEGTTATIVLPGVREPAVPAEPLSSATPAPAAPPPAPPPVAPSSAPPAPTSFSPPATPAPAPAVPAPFAPAAPAAPTAAAPAPAAHAPFAPAAPAAPTAAAPAPAAHAPFAPAAPAAPTAAAPAPAAHAPFAPAAPAAPTAAAPALFPHAPIAPASTAPAPITPASTASAAVPTTQTSAPASTSAAPAAVRPSDLSTSAGAPGGETLLLVDDEADLREVTARFLGGAGYRVLSAADAAEALRLLDRSDHPIAAMITDVVMPGMNGRQLARVAKQRRPDLRVVFISGFAEALIDESGNNLEPDSMIVAKPYTRDQLLAGVQSVLRSA
ncbi:ATP-binding response regulator [Actinoplanes sp. URMC 104]|uniref:ATP-binding response regulator n=1 Tax=Actinoplanes sp. URMC 104 TaxID=3423409 RepID=UPI003F1E1F01